MSSKKLILAGMVLSLVAGIQPLLKAGCNGTDFIVTPYDRIPNFGANPSIVSARNGNWSEASTWSPMRVPIAGDVVSIAPGTAVIYDSVGGDGGALDTVIIQAGAKFTFRHDISTRLMVRNLMVLERGELQIGTVASPIAANVTAEIIFPEGPLETCDAAEQLGKGLLAMGKVTICGWPTNPSFVRLAAEPLAGHTSFQFEKPVDWLPEPDVNAIGNKLIIPDTRQTGASNDLNYFYQGEKMTMTSISVDRKTVSFIPALQFNHKGVRDADGNLKILPHVGNMRRNVIIRSTPGALVRGHTFFTRRAAVDIRYALFYELGRTTVQPLNPDTNHIGRYPFHFHHLIGEANLPAEQYQFFAIGNAVTSSLTGVGKTEIKGGIIIHDSSWGLISGNIVYKVAGAGIVTEDGNERDNVISSNCVVAVDQLGPFLGRWDARGRGDIWWEGGGIWLRGYMNYVRDNVVSNALAAFGYFNEYANPRDVKVPSIKGGDPATGDFFMPDLTNIPIRQDLRNEIYGANIVSGHTAWALGTEAHHFHPDAQPSAIEGFRAWHIEVNAYGGYPTNKLTLKDWECRNDFEILKRGPGGGTCIDLGLGHYLAQDATVDNAVIEGFHRGVTTSANGFPQTIKNSRLKNYLNIQNYRREGVSPLDAPKIVVIKNNQFVPLTGVPNRAEDTPQSDITKRYAGVPFPHHVAALDQLFLYDYPAPGNSYKVFFREQAPGRIIEKTNPPDILDACPEAGLTNLECLTRFGKATGGELATCADELPRIFNGFVCATGPQPNRAPSVFAGPDQMINLPASANLDGTVSDDHLPNPPDQVTTVWTKVSGPGEVTFVNVSAVDTTASFLSAGTYVLRLTANDSALSASDEVTIVVNTPNAAPTVVTPASMTPSPVTGTTGRLIVLGADDGGERNLTYTWSTTGTPPAAVVFSNNGTNAAKDTTVTFFKAGTYVFQVVIRDGPGLTATSSVSVTVNATLSSILVTPANSQLLVNTSMQFNAEARDQFGDPLVPQPSFIWTVSGGGNISSAGEFTGLQVGGPFNVFAAARGVSGSAQVTVTATPPSGGNQSPLVTLDLPPDRSVYLAPATIDIKATASDPDGTVTNVAFYAGNTLLGHAPGAPYSFNWRNVGVGRYTLTAKATDNGGASTTSNMRNVEVNTIGGSSLSDSGGPDRVLDLRTENFIKFNCRGSARLNICTREGQEKISVACQDDIANFVVNKKDSFPAGVYMAVPENQKTWEKFVVVK